MTNKIRSKRKIFLFKALSHFVPYNLCPTTYLFVFVFMCSLLFSLLYYHKPNKVEIMLYNISYIFSIISLNWLSDFVPSLPAFSLEFSELGGSKVILGRITLVGLFQNFVIWLLGLFGSRENWVGSEKRKKRPHMLKMKTQLGQSLAYLYLNY